MTGFLYVCLGAAVGAPARYLLDRALQARRDSVMPWGTLLVNAVGSLVLGLVVGLARGAAVPEQVQLLVGTGLCGALTTYSTFGYETLRLVEDGARLYAAANVALSIGVTLALASGGCALGLLVT